MLKSILNFLSSDEAKRIEANLQKVKNSYNEKLDNYYNLF